MSRELSNLTDTDEEKSIYMAQNAFNRYLIDLLVENQLSSITDLNFHEVPFQKLTHFPDEAKETFKKVLKKNEGEVANTYGITIVGSEYKSLKHYKIQIESKKWAQSCSSFKTEFITRAVAGLKRKREKGSKDETELSSYHQAR